MDSFYLYNIAMSVSVRVREIRNHEKCVSFIDLHLIKYNRLNFISFDLIRKTEKISVSATENLSSSASK